MPTKTAKRSSPTKRRAAKNTVTRRKPHVLSLREAEAVAKYKQAYGNAWRKNLIQALEYGLHTPSGTRTFLAQGMSSDLISALEKLGVSGVKKYAVPRVVSDLLRLESFGRSLDRSPRSRF